MTDNLPPAGWYSDGHGVKRCWDGTHWTERVHPDHAQDEAGLAEDAETAEPAATNAESQAESKVTKFFKSRWFIGTTAAVIGIALGAAAGTADVTDSPKYKEISADLVDANSNLESLKEKMSPLQDEVDAVDERSQKLNERKRSLDQKAKDLKAKDKKLIKREKRVGIVEKEMESNTISGDGMYEVGADIKPGTYKTKGSAGCYYAVLNSPDNFDIANNGNIDGAGVVTVRKGQYLSLQRCADWVRQ